MLFVTPCTSMETDTKKKFSKAEQDWRRKSQLGVPRYVSWAKKLSFNIIFV